ncbi:hypothetical protein [Methylobacterium goesingense]|uniref:Uncharacterized protein n=2 Tax=Methylobacterium goesingense TaxID=243690 RepID=A0ABV2L2F6_9HYPH|nr:hypothetical protein CFIICLFH_0430 [Methylobacterium goesingense]
MIVAPWMRRRIARHVERGTSERVLACLLGTHPAEPASDGPADFQTIDPGDARPDLSNVILFRALNHTRGHSAVKAT